MSDADETCEYVLDPDDPETWGGEEGDECYADQEILNEDGAWTCPHDAEEGADLCIFHLPSNKKDDEEVVDQFCGILDGVSTSDDPEMQKRKLEFLGAKFGSFDLSERPPKLSVANVGIAMSHMTVTGALDWFESKFDIPHLRCAGATFLDDAGFQSVEFGGKTVFENAEFKEKVSFEGTKFRREGDFQNAEFGGKAIFVGAEFNEASCFQFVKFGKRSTFQRAKLGGEAAFVGVKFYERASFMKTEFDNKAVFYRTEFKDETTFKFSEFGGDANFRDTVFIGDVIFQGASFNEGADFTSTEFWKEASFSGSEFVGEINFNWAEFNGNTDFEAIKLNKKAKFRGTNFGGDTDFRGAEFKEGTRFKSTSFGGTTSFFNAEFGGDAVIFTEANFERDVEFTNAYFGKYVPSDVYFFDVEFSGETKLNDVWFGGSVSFTEAIFKQDANFYESEFFGEVGFTNVKFQGVTNFQNLSLNDAEFNGADLTGAVLSGAELCRVNFESALLSRATLFGADLRGAKLNGAVIGDVRINEDTKFLGHPSDDSDTSPHTVSAIRSQQECVYDPDYEEDNEHANVDKAKSVYRALEELGGKHARPRLQARSFVRRQDLQKQNYWDDATADDVSLEERLIAGARWSQAKVARTTLLYGESPWRVIAWSLGIILSFALLYPLGGWMKPSDGNPITYAQIASNPVEILNSIYYSTLTYTALGFGDFQPVGLGRLLTTLETGLGAVMLALLVFILGRRAAR